MQLKDNDLNLLKKIFYKQTTKTLSDSESGSKKLSYTTGVDAKLFPMIRDILARYIDLDGSKIFKSFLLESFQPWTIHTDYDDSVDPTIAVLIPFVTANTYTIIFDQECLCNFDNFIRDNQPIDDPATLAEADNLLSHVDSNGLRYLTIKERAPWVEGKPIIWDLKALHSSDNFKQSNVESKSAAVIWFTKA